AVAPEELAVLRRHAHQAVRQQLHVLPDPPRLGDDDGRIARRVAARHRALPDDLAGLLVERHEGRVLAAGGADEPVAVNERRLSELPAAAGAAEVLLEVLAPDHLAVGRLRAGQVAVLADGVDAVAVHRRGAAEVAARPADLGGPEDLAVLR